MIENYTEQIVPCDSSTIEIFDDKENKHAVDIIHAAVGYELLKNDAHEVEQQAKDYIDSEKLELREMSDEGKLISQICNQKFRFVS